MVGEDSEPEKNVFRIGGNTFYDRKNKIPMKIPEFKRSRIGLIAEFCRIPNGLPNQDSPFQGRVPFKHWRKIKRKPRVRMRMSNNAHVPWPTYLWPLLWKLFQVGCRVECSLRKWLKWICQADSSARHKATCVAFQAEDSGARVHFNMDSIPIGILNHAS
jgi:hypothetical protein